MVVYSGEAIAIGLVDQMVAGRIVIGVAMAGNVLDRIVVVLQWPQTLVKGSAQGIMDGRGLLEGIIPAPNGTLDQTTDHH